MLMDVPLMLEIHSKSPTNESSSEFIDLIELIFVQLTFDAPLKIVISHACNSSL